VLTTLKDMVLTGGEQDHGKTRNTTPLRESGKQQNGDGANQCTGKKKAVRGAVYAVRVGNSKGCISMLGWGRILRIHGATRTRKEITRWGYALKRGF